ncbi:MAG TPA: shikimate dehydrogenase [Nocardioides sp.]|nr:shikimate dehydrogenase [Nocardioides sp.]
MPAEVPARTVERRCAVLGDPVGHSLSPVLHRAAYAERGLAWTYDACRVPAGGLAGFLADLDDTWVGLSVTMPLKREALAAATVASATALQAGSANTLLRTPDGWHADNTDVPGAVAALLERHAEVVEAGTVLGGGATAASVGLALAELGARRVRLLVRDPDRAVETVAAIRSHPAAPDVEVLNLSAPVLGDVLVSTIPAGAQSVALVERVAHTPIVFDVLYDPWPTPLAAAATGTVIGGLDLLVHQAARQFQMFTGLPAPLEAMRVAGREALASR